MLSLLFRFFIYFQIWFFFFSFLFDSIIFLLYILHLRFLFQVSYLFILHSVFKAHFYFYFFNLICLVIWMLTNRREADSEVRLQSLRLLQSRIWSANTVMSSQNRYRNKDLMWHIDQHEGTVCTKQFASLEKPSLSVLKLYI